MSNKVTKKEMFEAIKLAAEADMIPRVLTKNIKQADVIAFCTNEIALLDKKTAKAREAAAQKKADGDELLEATYAVLSHEEFKSIGTIAAEVTCEDASVAKITYRLKVLVDTGRAEKAEIDIPTENGKTTKRMGYRAL